MSLWFNHQTDHKKQKPVLEMWPNSFLKLRLFDSYCRMGQNKLFWCHDWFYPWNNVHGTNIEISYYWPITSLGCVSDWLCRVENLPQTKRNTSQIWVVICHQYRISALLPQTLFRGISKCWLVSLANKNTAQWNPVVEMLNLN